MNENEPSSTPVSAEPAKQDATGNEPTVESVRPSFDRAFDQAATKVLNENDELLRRLAR